MKESIKTKPGRFPHTGILSAVLTMFVILAVGYGVAIPPGEGVDEKPHFDYVRYVKEHRALPIQPQSREQGVQVWMGHHPPLYYVLGGLVISWIDTSDSAEVLRFNPHFVWQENSGSNGWNVTLHFGQDRCPWKGAVLAMYVVRLMTIGFGAVALYAIYRATQLLFPGHPWASLGAMVWIGFNPSFIFMSSTVHHDTLQSAIFALTIWWALRFLKGPERRCDTWLGGVLVGFALLTKLSGLVLVPVTGLALLLRAWRNRDWRRLLPQALSLSISVALVAGWWFVRNQWLYGDPLGWRMFLNIHGHMIRPGAYTWSSFVDEFLKQLGHTFWGAFGYMNITFPEITKYLWWLTGLAGIGLIIGLVRGGFIPRALWPEWTVTLTVLLLLFASFVRFSIATVGAGHGRYLFPAGVSIGALLSAGLNGFTTWRHQRTISASVAVGMIIYAIWLPVKFVLPKYDPPRTATADEQAETRPVGAVFANALELIGYENDTDVVVPGQRLRVRLYWRAVGSPDTRPDPLARLQVTDEQGNVLVSDTRWPVPSMPPSVWAPGAVYVTRMTVHMPAEGLVGRLDLRVGTLSKDKESYFPVRDASGSPYEDSSIIIKNLIGVGTVVKVRADGVPNPRREVFASTLALRGFELPDDRVSRGDVVPVSLYWEVLEKPVADYTVFVHVLNDDGELITQCDRPPGGGTAPTSTWQVGEVLRDTYPLPIPSDASAGIYTVRVGMYTWPSLERLPISMDGVSVGDSIDLGSIQIQP